MSTLDSVLEYKRQKEAQEAADISAIPSALAAFQAGRQLAEQNTLKRLTLQGTLATKGLELVQDPSGMYTIRRNESLLKPQSELDQLIKRGNAADAAKSLGDRELFNALQVGGGTQSGAQPQAGAEPSSPDSTGVEGMIAPEVDPMTGKLTTRGVQQEQKNKMIAAKQEAELKAEVPTAKQKEDADAIRNAEANLDNLYKNTSKLPKGYKALWADLGNFFTRGETDPKLVTYNDSRPAIAVGLYRTLTGDTRLSDADAAKRALPLIWNSSEGKSVHDEKFANLKNLIKARKRLIESKKYTQTPDGDFITPLELVSSEANKMNDKSGKDGKAKSSSSKSSANKSSSIPEGATGTASDGTPVVRKGGKWVANA